MAKKRDKPNEKEAARAAAPAPKPCCCEARCACLDEAKAKLAAAKSLPDIAAVLYGLPSEDRGKLYAEVVAARDRVLGVA